jgi:hypothetical protein
MLSFRELTPSLTGCHQRLLHSHHLGLLPRDCWYVLIPSSISESQPDSSDSRTNSRGDRHHVRLYLTRVYDID